MSTLHRLSRQHVLIGFVLLVSLIIGFIPARTGAEEQPGQKELEETLERYTVKVPAWHFIGVNKAKVADLRELSTKQQGVRHPQQARSSPGRLHLR